MEYVGGISGAALGYIVGNVPGAVYGAKMGYNAGLKRKNLSENMQTPRNVRRRLSFGGRTTTPGSGRSVSYYRKKKRGPMRFRTSKKKYLKKRKRNYKKNKRVKKKKNYFKEAAMKGYICREETYGTVNDEHCVYIKHSTNFVDKIAEAFCGASIRKLFTKAGYHIPDADTVLSGTGFQAVSSGSYRLLFTYYNPGSSGAPTDYAATLTGSLTLAEIAQGITFQDYFKFMRQYFNNVHGDTPYALALQTVDNITGTWTTQASLMLESEIMHIGISSTLRIQNRTLNPTSSISTDVVDNQPLIGKLYKFRGGDVRTRTASLNPSAVTDSALNGIRGVGVELLQSSVLENEYKEPPTKYKFSNCYSVSNISIGVGETQKTSFLYEASGIVKKFITNFRSQRGFDNDLAVLQKNYIVKGKCEMVALEEMVRTASENKIVVGYEREITIAVHFTSKNNTTFGPVFTTRDVTTL